MKQYIHSFITGNDVFVSLPTGYGKSLCFVLLPLVFDRILGCSGYIVLCISPLTSLMMEQREKYTVLGLSCGIRRETTTATERGAPISTESQPFCHCLAGQMSGEICVLVRHKEKDDTYTNLTSSL